MEKMHLLTPGPVELADPIRLSLSQPMIYHRGPEIKALLGDIVPRLKKDFNADHILIITGSGSAAIEMGFASLTKQSDKALVLSNGTFGEKLSSCSKIYCSTQTESIPLGKGWSLERAKKLIDESGANILAMVYNETSTGVLNDAKSICSYAKGKGMLTILDSVSGWGAAPLDMKEFGVDYTATGSQKAIGASPGIAIAALSEHAMKLAESLPARSFYLDAKKYKKEIDTFQTPYTPAVSVLFSVKAALDHIDSKGGFAAHRARHEAAAEKSRKFVEGMGLQVFSEKGFHSPTITGFVLENADEVRKRLREEHHLVSARDFGELKGRFFRICHIGNFDDAHLDYCFAAIRKVLGKQAHE